MRSVSEQLSITVRIFDPLKNPMVEFSKSHKKNPVKSAEISKEALKKFKL